MIRRLQALLQWLFLRVEALFNAAFGDRLNPLYHLGSITFYLFWLVAGSGLYLYAFFETGVADAYASVQSLTHGQWFAGGVLRSVHRYASDAMVLTMLLHMVRHFAFNHYRAFRWFSWVSGVALIWGVYVSGINGYMLPWDRLAQFVIVSSFEWLDWLPGFGGTLMRNFIYASSVSDRFFSLLSFMHIGIPLVVLLLMWVHVQRVPKARTAPPRSIMVSVALTLLALSALAPVRSQGGAADLAQAVAQVQLDWFYLLVFPLLTLWPLGQVWALLVGASAVLVLVPWLPPRWRRGGARRFQLSVHGVAAPVAVRAGETLLEAGLREGLALPYECRNGGCGKCRCSVLHGQVDHGVYQRSALSDAQRASGQALMCCATPLSDLEIEVEGELPPQPAALRYRARVERLERLTPEVMRLTLAVRGAAPPAFVVGQYIHVILGDGERRAFSFANAPHDNQRIELHVRLIPGGRFTGAVFSTMQAGDELEFEGPFGDFRLSDSNTPIVFVAGATGFAPIKSIVEDAFHRGIQRPMWLYWGVRRRRDLYLLELAEQWQAEHANFHVVPVLSEPGDDWAGRRGLVHEAMLHDFPDLSGHEVYVCGSVKMVEAAVPAFIARGLSEDVCFSDSFLPSRGVGTVQPSAT
ncbi:MAG TPA: 2Fe-2S iron-sulfur cluster-binding protein [Burkholderiaceae bacterium]|nr:2Fe-2S iron-sulfur cluster-binding protein [Burkholderiaceae bacterium]